LYGVKYRLTGFFIFIKFLYNFWLGVITHLKIYQKLIVLLIIFSMAMASVAYGKDRKLEVIIFPFKNYWDLNYPIQGAEDIIRSELFRSGYFIVAEQERTYKFMREAVLSNFIKIENVDVETAAPKADIVDLFAHVQLKVVMQVAEKMKADFAIKGTLTQFGEKFRADLEVINVKEKKTETVLVGESELKEKIPEMLEQLSQQIVNVCKSAWMKEDINNIQSGYQQGKLTYEKAIEGLKKLSAEMPEVFVIHCITFSYYLGRPEMINNLIEEGEKVIHLFNANQEEDVRCLSSLGIDPFYELANAYILMEKLDNAIEVYNRAILVYPMNHIKYYKQLGSLYKIEGKIDASIDALKQVLKLDPPDYETRLKLASLYETKGEISDALEQYQYCLKYAKNSEESSKIKEIIKCLPLQAEVHNK